MHFPDFPALQAHFINPIVFPRGPIGPGGILVIHFAFSVGGMVRHTFEEAISNRPISRWVLHTRDGYQIIMATRAKEAVMMEVTRVEQARGLNVMTDEIHFKLEATGDGMARSFSCREDCAPIVNPVESHGACSVAEIKPKAVCVCPIRDLMSNGHHAGCPEKS